METASIQSLRDLQKSLNTAIDSYIETAERNREPSAKPTPNTRKDVSDSASRIIAAVTDPFEEITGLWVQVKC
jgi:hypothetical protein